MFNNAAPGGNSAAAGQKPTSFREQARSYPSLEVLTNVGASLLANPACIQSLFSPECILFILNGFPRINDVCSGANLPAE